MLKFLISQIPQKHLLSQLMQQKKYPIVVMILEQALVSVQEQLLEHLYYWLLHSIIVVEKVIVTKTKLITNFLVLMYRVQAIITLLENLKIPSITANKQTETDTTPPLLVKTHLLISRLKIWSLIQQSRTILQMAMQSYHQGVNFREI